jgi:hypothetical protein
MEDRREIYAQTLYDRRYALEAEIRNSMDCGTILRMPTLMRMRISSVQNTPTTSTSPNN